ncbi:uncharacterized protein PG998_006386 [Apiospora kogelbergensis]|uniref:uncharacterized protein n=1 Tax=Apiospora kogelbergensis TaxID=1337665 RepID=UPI00312D31DF
MAEFTIADKTLGSLRGKVIIVTGGSSGIGLAAVGLLLGLGAAVISGDLHPPPAPQVIYPSAGSAVPAFFTHVPTDVGAWADLVALFKRAVRIHGRVDHVFCNPGAMPDDCGSPLPPPLVLAYIKGSLDVAGLSSTIRVNVLIPEQAKGKAPPGAQDKSVIPSASPSARGAAHLMADTARHGQIVYAGGGRYWEMEEETILLPAVRSTIEESFPSHNGNGVAGRLDGLTG